MKRILVIGATSAIATACAREWAARGSEFYLVARDSLKLHETANDLIARGAEGVHEHVLDLNHLDKHQELVETCASTLGQIDIVLVAHGTLPDQLACQADSGLALLQFASNCTSTISMLTIIANHMEIQRYGTIAVISSVAGDRGRPSNYLYGSAKAAVSTFCEGLRARMFKKGVHVIDIRPGFVDTPMTAGLKLPTMLLATPEVVAKLILLGIDSRKNVVYTPKFWSIIMLTIKSVPTFIFKRLNL